MAHINVESANSHKTYFLITYLDTHFRSHLQNLNLNFKVAISYVLFHFDTRLYRLMINDS